MNIKITLALFLLISSTTIAQNIDYAKLNVEYTRLPLKPVSKDVKNYQVLILADYLGKIEKQKADRQLKN